MKKIFRLLFSRATFVAIVIAIQIFATIWVISAFSEFYWQLKLVSTAVMVIVLLGIIHRDMQPEGKIPWVIYIALFPITGVILYLAFSRNYAARKERRLFRQLPQITLAESKPTAPSQFLGQINYLKEQGAPAFTDSKTKYFENGETFWEDLLTELEKAKKFIFMEYFIVERGKMLDAIMEILKRKVKEGVEVRFMYDDVGSLAHTKRSFMRKVKKLGIKCARFGKIRPVVSAVYNNRDHRKICVIDGKTGYIGGINLADEYINHTHPFGYWKDTAVRIQGKAVSSLTLMFLQMFYMATHKKKDDEENFSQYIFDPYAEPPEQENKDDIIDQLVAETDGSVDIVSKIRSQVYDEKNWTNTQNYGVVVPFGDGPKPIYSEYIGRNVYLNLINQSEHDLYITTPYLIVDDAFLEALMRAAKRGVNVNIVIPGIPDKKLVYAMTKQSCRKLMKAGVRIHRFTKGFVHAKSVLSDGVAGVVGTINVDYRSFVHHYECGVFMYKTAAVSELYDDLMQTLTQCEFCEKPPKLNVFERLVCLLGGALRPLL